MVNIKSKKIGVLLFLPFFSLSLHAGSLALKEVLEESVESKSEILKSKSFTEEVEAQRNLARSSFLPQLSATLKKEYAKSIVPEQEVKYPEIFSLNFQMQILDVSSIYNFKKMNRAFHSRTSEEEYEKGKYLRDLANAFIDYYEAQNILKITQDNVKLLTDYREATQERFDYGDSTILEVDKVQARLYAMESDLSIVESDLQNKKETFLSVYGHENLDLGEVKLFAPEKIKKLISLPLEKNEKEIAILDQRLSSLDAGLKSVYMAHLPTVSLIGSYTNSTPDNFQFNSREKSYKVGLQVNIPLLSGGDKAAQSGILVAQKNQALRDREILVRQKNLEATRLKKNLFSSFNSWQMQQKGLEANQRVYRALNKEMKGSMRTTFDVLNALDDLYKSTISVTKNYTLMHKRAIDYLYGYGSLDERFIKENF